MRATKRMMALVSLMVPSGVSRTGSLLSGEMVTNCLFLVKVSSKAGCSMTTPPYWAVARILFALKLPRGAWSF